MLECMGEGPVLDRPHYRVCMPIARQQVEEERFPSHLLHDHLQVTEPKLEDRLRGWLLNWRLRRRRR